MHIFFAFLFGSIVGSFLNVVILRLHTGRSLNGRSHCMSCGLQLRVRDLFPIVSYLVLRGRCRDCTSKISSRYLMVELTTGVLFALIVWQFATTPLIALIFCLVAALLVVIFVYDLRHTIIPNEFVLLLTACALIFLYMQYLNGVRIELLYSLGAACIASGIFGVLWLASRGRLIGLGDAKLMFPLGLMLSASGTLSFIVLSFWIGTLYVLVVTFTQKVMRRLIHRHFSLPQYTMRSEVPFGPFLIIGFFAVLIGHVDILALTQTFADATTRVIYFWLLK